MMFEADDKTSGNCLACRRQRDTLAKAYSTGNASMTALSWKQLQSQHSCSASSLPVDMNDMHGTGEHAVTSILGMQGISEKAYLIQQTKQEQRLMRARQPGCCSVRGLAHVCCHTTQNVCRYRPAILQNGSHEGTGGPS